MKCPTCLQNTVPDRWIGFVTEDPVVREEAERFAKIYGGAVTSHLKEDLAAEGGTTYTIDWMRCGNAECKQLVIRMHVFNPGGYLRSETRETWFVLPRFSAAARAVDPLVPENFRRDFLEAAAILHLSPRMSAVLARSILADLLAEYAGHHQFKLEDRIDAFNQNSAHPRALRDNLHRFREAADLSAHTSMTEQGEVIRIEHGEAAWTLDLVERLFAYLI